MGSGFYFYSFLGFDGLVQTVGVTASFHDTACLLVHNLNLSVDDYVFIVFLEHGICFQQLVDGMYTFRLDGIVGHQSIFFSQALFVGQVFLIFQSGKLGGNVGQYEEGRVVRIACNQVNTFIGQIYTVQLFIDDEVQWISNFVHTFVVLFHIDFFRLEHAGFDTRFAQEFNQGLVLGQTLVATI